MALVLQLGDVAAVVVLADHAAEHDAGAGLRVIDRGLEQRRLQRLLGHRHQPKDRVDVAAGTLAPPGVPFPLGSPVDVIRPLRRRAGGRRRRSCETACSSSGASTRHAVAHAAGRAGQRDDQRRADRAGHPAGEHRGRHASRARPAAAPRRCPGSRGRAAGATASGVTSVGVSPVPPVVSTACAPAARAASTASRMAATSSGTMRRSTMSWPAPVEQVGQQLAAVVGALAARPSGSSR